MSYPKAEVQAWYNEPALEKKEYNLINPTHHKGKSGMQAWDVVEEFNLSYNIGTASVYLLRAGKKPDQSYEQDIIKAIRHQIQELKTRGIEFELVRKN